MLWTLLYKVQLCFAPCISCWLTEMELCCQGLNSSCKRPAAPCHAPLLPRWLWDVPAALRRCAHEESVMEWLSKTPGSIPHCTTATLLLLQPPGRTPKSGEDCLCCLVCQLTNGRQRRWWCPQRRPACSRACGGVLESTCHSWPGMPLISPKEELSLALSRWPAEVWQTLLISVIVCFNVFLYLHGCLW